MMLGKLKNLIEFLFQDWQIKIFNHINNKDALINEGINSDKIVISEEYCFFGFESNCLLKRDNNSSEKYILLTLHRPENVDDKSKLKGLLKSINSLNIKIKFITHLGYQNQLIIHL